MNFGRGVFCILKYVGKEGFSHEETFKWKHERSEAGLSISLQMTQFCAFLWLSNQFSSVSQSCLTLCDPMNGSKPGLPVNHQLPECTKPMCIELVMPSSHLILCCPLLLLLPTPPSIRVFSNESTLHMRWPKYWSFSFRISPSKKSKRLSRVFSNTKVKIINSSVLSFLHHSTLTSIYDYWKNHSLD